jgi:hypothetical protein
MSHTLSFLSLLPPLLIIISYVAILNGRLKVKCAKV